MCVPLLRAGFCNEARIGLCRRDLELLSGMDHIGVRDDVAVCVKDLLPRQAVLLADLREIVAMLDSVGIAAGRRLASRDVSVQNQIA